MNCFFIINILAFSHYYKFNSPVFLGAFHLVRTQFYMLSAPFLPLFACNTQWKCIRDSTHLSPQHTHTLGAYILNGRPLITIVARFMIINAVYILLVYIVYFFPRFFPLVFLVSALAKKTCLYIFSLIFHIYVIFPVFFLIHIDAT